MMTGETRYPKAAAAIVDQAFILMEKSPPSSFGDDTPEAEDASRHYPEALSTCLEACDWSFASRVVDLPEAELPALLAPDRDLPFIYSLPADCVKVREVGDRHTRWRVDEIWLRTSDRGPIRLRYTRRIENEKHTSARFRVALATELASRLAPRWLGTASKVEGLVNLAELRLKKAMAEDRVAGSQQTWHGGSSDLWSEGIRR